MSFIVSFLWHGLGVPSTKVPIDITTFSSYVVPPVGCYMVAAMLAVTSQAHALRVALWPVATLSAFQAAVSVDVSGGNPELKFINMDFALCMLSVAIYTLSWTLTERSHVRYHRPANCSPSVLTDALDLATNLRGHGWELSRGVHIPRETRPTNRMAFACYALLSGAAHGTICGSLSISIQTFITGVGSGPLEGSTIFDETLPFLVRHLRANLIAILGAFATYAIIQMRYDLFTVLGILLFRQDPTQWPPAFDSPWRATSLTEFWGRRWHQFFRRMFLLGAYPFSVVLGRAGMVIGAFLSSGLYHHMMMLTVDGRSEMWRMIVPFGMMAPGIFAERAFYRFTGRKVGGGVGWVWTMAWLLLWGNVVIDGFARVGMFTSLSALESLVPLYLRALLQKSVMDFDAWLHTV